MNLEKLFETQKLLDTAIVEKKGLQGRDLLPEKILALQVELGECANEWRGFKFWSEYQKPKRIFRTTVGATEENAVEFICGHEECGERFEKTDARLKDLFGHNSEDCPVCVSGTLYAFRESYPLLEEYVDCLHFILSIGNDLGLGDRGYTPNEGYCEIIKSLGIKKILIGLMSTPMKLVNGLHEKREFQSIYSEIIIGFQMLGELLGFTPDQIEQAYYAKNEINHERQATGY